MFFFLRFLFRPLKMSLRGLFFSLGLSRIWESTVMDVRIIRLQCITAKTVNYYSIFHLNISSSSRLVFKVLCNEFKRVLACLLLLRLFLPILHITSYREPMHCPREPLDHQFLTQILRHNLFHLIQLIFTHDIILIPF